MDDQPNAFCGSTRNVEVGHLDGFEENTEKPDPGLPILQHPDGTRFGGSYASGVKVCLTAEANYGFGFSSLSGNPLDRSGCVVMNANNSVTANLTSASAGGSTIFSNSAVPANPWSYDSTPSTWE